MKSVISWHSSLHGDIRSAAQCGAVPGQQPRCHQGQDGPVTWAWPCLLATINICQMWARRSLGRIPSQGRPPSATPLLSQSPIVWHNRMVWGSWALHALSSTQWGCWQPCAPLQDTFELFCFSSGTCLFSTTPCSLSGKVLQILALRLHHQLHLP